MKYIADNSEQPNAWVEMGERYHFALDGLHEDHVKAFEYFKKAADFDSPEGLYWVADYYRLGIGVEQDYKKYFYYLEKAAAAGSYAAWTNMSIAYYFGKDRYDGNGYNKDDEKSIICNKNALICIEKHWEQYTHPNYKGFQELYQRLANGYIHNTVLIAEHYRNIDKKLSRYWLDTGNNFFLTASGYTHPELDKMIASL